MIITIFKKIWKAIKAHLKWSVERYSTSWLIQLIVIVLLFLYILIDIIWFTPPGPYVLSSQKNKIIKNDIRIEREECISNIPLIENNIMERK
jgi:hypothetical protein